MENKHPRSGGFGSMCGEPKLNEHLKRTTNQSAQSHKTVDSDRDWPGMYDLARSLTAGKWSKPAK